MPCGFWTMSLEVGKSLSLKFNTLTWDVTNDLVSSLPKAGVKSFNAPVLDWLILMLFATLSPALNTC